MDEASRSQAYGRQHGTRSSYTPCSDVRRKQTSALVLCEINAGRETRPTIVNVSRT